VEPDELVEPVGGDLILPALPEAPIMPLGFFQMALVLKSPFLR
jgi:hypothetical protein